MKSMLGILARRMKKCIGERQPGRRFMFFTQHFPVETGGFNPIRKLCFIFDEKRYINTSLD